jgi:16S rRNA G527 N7-methylase RsmG
VTDQSKRIIKAAGGCARVVLHFDLIVKRGKHKSTPMLHFCFQLGQQKKITVYILVRFKNLFKSMKNDLILLGFYVLKIKPICSF